MRESKRLAPQKKHSRASAQTKRKYFDDKQQNDLETGSKRQKLVYRTKTLTLKPHSSRSNLPALNRFEPIYSSSSRSRKHKHDWSRSSSIAESNRKWVFSGDDFSAYSDRIVFVSYNILGVENASKHPDLYFKIPPECLEWDRRKELICKEINRYNADILCFQEVDRFNDLDCLLQNDGFRGLYKARTGEAYDGCAIFWRDTLFTLLHEENIEFQNFGLRDNVAQLCVLKMNENQSESDLCMQSLKAKSTPARRLVVGNVHVLFNPKRGDIKLGQVRLFLERAHKLSQEWGGIPVILGGDLNSLPQSAIYQFLSQSELDVLVHDRRNISGQLEHPPQNKYFRSPNDNVKSNNMCISRRSMRVWSDDELRLATGSRGVTHLRHQLKLFSAYIGVPGTHRSRDSCGEPLATSYHSQFMGTVDYIWHTEELLPVRVLETLPMDILRRSAGLPNEKLGSDHLALVCELAFVDDDSRT
ncbi:carbon catabolite repressor protein 4 homolog 5 isoform X2 [Jatropha curcas]|uniref:carbon catabolite repressor protein 4 homolog 5 isoform X2 n=1 Tax=Jatropha curcas TaxID=180498 RepID=UPI0005FB0F03|nr:carbon catabolite repressor protein 4 homolog 5 isoform X2 [Jatropha curcas]